MSDIEIAIRLGNPGSVKVSIEGDGADAAYHVMESESAVNDVINALTAARDGAFGKKAKS